MKKAKFNVQLLRIAILGLVSFFYFLSFRCLERPQLPSWNTEITVPLINDTYRIADLLKASSKFRVLDDSIVQFYTEFNIDTIKPKKLLNLSEQNYYQHTTISEFQIESLYVGRLVLSLNDIIGAWLPESTVKVIISSFTQTINTWINLQDLRWLELNSGILKCRAQNFTNLSFDSLIIKNSLISNLRINGIDPNSNGLSRHKLEYTYLETPLPVQVVLGSPGSFPDSINVCGLDSLVIEFMIDSLKVTRGELRLPEIRAKKQTAMNISNDQRFRMDSLELATGEALLNFFNSFPSAIWINLTIKKVNYNQTFRIESRDCRVVPVSLAGLKLNRTDLSDGSFNNSISFAIDVDLTSESCREIVTFERDDGLIFNCQLTNLSFRYLFGEWIQPIYLTLPEKTLFSFPKQGMCGIKVAHAEVSLHLLNTIGFPAAVRYLIFAHKDSGNSIYQVENINIPPGSDDFPTELNLTIPVTDIINFGASQIKYSIDVQFSGQGRINAYSFIRGNGCLSTPLRIAFNDDTTFFGEYRFGLSEKDRQTIIDWQSGRYGIKVIAAELYLNLSNHFPVSFDARLVVAKDTTGTNYLSDSIVIPIHIPAGTVGLMTQNPHCIQATDSTLVIGLDEEAIRIFTYPKLKSHLFLYSIPSDTVTIHAKDYLSFLSHATIKLQVK